MVRKIREAKEAKTRAGGAIHCDTNRFTSSASEITSYDLPEIDSFDGKKSEWANFENHVTNKLGMKGLLDYIEKKTACTRNPPMARAIFYLLREAIWKGSAGHIIPAMENQKSQCPHDLWQRLLTEYKTVNDNMQTVMGFLDLQLDVHTEPTRFISDFKRYREELRKRSNPIGSDDNSLRSILINAIKDDDFSPVVEELKSNPTATFEEQMEFVRLQQMVLETSNRGSCYQETTTNIPFFPHSWKKLMGEDRFQLLLYWRRAMNNRSNSGESIREVTKRFEAEIVEEGESPSKSQKKRKLDE